MIEKYKNAIIGLLSVFGIIILFIRKDFLENAVMESMVLFLENVFPFLFVFVILENILIKHNFIYYLDKLLRKFKIRNSLNVFIIFISILGGSPTNAVTIKDLLNSNIITTKDANTFLMYMYFGNPLFLFHMLSILFSNNFITIKIIVSHYLSNIVLMGVLKHPVDYKIPYQKNRSFARTVNEGIKNSINTSLIVIGTITFFMIIQNVFVFSKTQYGSVMIGGLLEVTQGLKLLVRINGGIIKEIIALCIISFGGLSIHMQILSCLDSSEIQYKHFLLGRLITTLISIIIYLLLTCFKI